ncbi:hypothetical protein NMY22_g839 [Coprinellus aureogranulatus]|nr:hypothetical protein NMY22_g839 [Coprinellus aureogranulatus]
MTEYDFSPAAQAAYQAKLRQVAQWTNNVPNHPEELSNPFVATPRAPESDFYRKKKIEKERRGRARGRRRGYESDGYSSSSSSDDDGPDRPPTPPASAPVAGGFYHSPWQQA